MLVTTQQLHALYIESARHLADLKANGAPAVLIQHEAHEASMLRLALRHRTGVDPR
jgi:hypothetical protein